MEFKIRRIHLTLAKLRVAPPHRIELLRSTAAQCPETSAVVISSTPAWCDCVLTFIRSIYLDPIRNTVRSARTRGSRGPFIHSCFKRDFYGNRYSYSISTVVSFFIEFVFDTNFDIFEYRTGTALSKVVVADRELI